MNNRYKCNATKWDTECTPECEWYINSPQYFNCFLVYRHYIRDCEHTLQEVAALLDISHTTVKQLETNALRKIREMMQSGQISELDLKRILNINTK